MKKIANGLSDRVFLHEEVVFDDWTRDDLNLFLFLVRRLPPSDGVRDRNLEMRIEEFYPFFGKVLPANEVLARILSFSKKGIAFLRTYYDEIRKREYTERDGYTVVSAFSVENKKNVCSGEEQEKVRLVFLGLLSRVYDKVRLALANEEVGMVSLFDDTQMLLGLNDVSSINDDSLVLSMRGEK